MALGCELIALRAADSGDYGPVLAGISTTADTTPPRGADPEDASRRRAADGIVSAVTGASLPRPTQHNCVERLRD